MRSTEQLSSDTTRFFIDSNTIKRFIDVKNEKAINFGFTDICITYWKGPDKVLRDFHNELVLKGIIKEHFKG